MSTLQDTFDENVVELVEEQKEIFKEEGLLSLMTDSLAEAIQAHNHRDIDDSEFCFKQFYGMATLSIAKSLADIAGILRAK